MNKPILMAYNEEEKSRRIARLNQLVAFVEGRRPEGDINSGVLGQHDYKGGLSVVLTPGSAHWLVDAIHDGWLLLDNSDRVHFDFGDEEFEEDLVSAVVNGFKACLTNNQTNMGLFERHSRTLSDGEKAIVGHDTPCGNAFRQLAARGVTLKDFKTKA